jgi:hypothetical protein
VQEYLGDEKFDEFARSFTEGVMRREGGREGGREMKTILRIAIKEGGGSRKRNKLHNFLQDASPMRGSEIQ